MIESDFARLEAETSSAEATAQKVAAIQADADLAVWTVRVETEQVRAEAQSAATRAAAEADVALNTLRATHAAELSALASDYAVVQSKYDAIVQSCLPMSLVLAPLVAPLPRL